ncbi:MAG: FAD-dependent oxidoreductase [Oscillospiraceae bacterium]|nr:FAD-dependent oxidoreductase [Oscillospiraceae bacterium]MDD4367344.1 FAD-dependent oxidoreductase [Oscillospiraceae bacterium]
MAEKILIIGASAAGIAAASGARQQSAAAEIVVLSKEPDLPYFRTRLCAVLESPRAADQILLHKPSWYTDRQIELRLNTEVREILPQQHQVRLADQSLLGYDRLILATGSRSFMPPLEGSGLDGVCTLWTLADARRIEARLPGVKKAVVIGGGLLGLEAAYALSRRGIDTTIIEFAPRLLVKQLDEAASALFTRHVEHLGIHVVTSGNCQKLESLADQPAVAAVCLADGRRFEADLVMVSTGVRAQTEVAVHTPLAVDRCFVADTRMQTNLPDIYAAGDDAICEHRWYGLWSIAQAQGRVAGINAAGGTAVLDMPVPPYLVNTMGTKIASAGRLNAENQDPQYREEVSQDQARGYYRKLTFSGEQLTGYCLLGDTAEFSQLQKRLQA